MNQFYFHEFTGLSKVRGSDLTNRLQEKVSLKDIFAFMTSYS